MLDAGSDYLKFGNRMGRNHLLELEVTRQTHLLLSGFNLRKILRLLRARFLYFYSAYLWNLGDGRPDA